MRQTNKKGETSKMSDKDKRHIQTQGWAETRQMTDKDKKGYRHNKNKRNWSETKQNDGHRQTKRQRLTEEYWEI